MSIKTKKPHSTESDGNTYAKVPSIYSIIDVVNFLIQECNALNEPKKAQILQKALEDICKEDQREKCFEIEFDKMVYLIREVLNLNKTELYALIDFLEKNETLPSHYRL